MTTLPEGPATPLRLPFPESLPWRRADLDAAVDAAAAAVGGRAADPARAFAEPEGLQAWRSFLAWQWADSQDPVPGPDTPADRRWVLGPPTEQAQAEQVEHDRYFLVLRDDGGAPSFVAGLVAAHLAAYENSAAMGVTLLDDRAWHDLHDGLATLFRARTPAEEPAPMPDMAGWRRGPGYDPAARWLIGHQLFFALIQGAVTGLNIFAAAAADPGRPGAPADAGHGLRLAAAFLRSSSAAMRFASDFDPVDYESTVRKDMAPPKVREGFSGFQTRDHAHMVRLLTALRPLFAARSGGAEAQQELVDAVSGAYASHEFICARFRGDVLPSLRMAAASRGLSDRPGVEVVRELMRKRLGLLAAAGPDAGA